VQWLLVGIKDVEDKDGTVFVDEKNGIREVDGFQLF